MIIFKMELHGLVEPLTNFKSNIFLDMLVMLKDFLLKMYTGRTSQESLLSVLMIVIIRALTFLRYSLFYAG